MLDLAGLDISGAPQVIRSVKEILDAARLAGVPIVYLQMGYQPDLSDGGGPGSPNWHKELGIRTMNCQPELKGKLVTVGGWDFDIVDEIKPHPGDLVIVKTRQRLRADAARGGTAETRDSIFVLRGDCHQRVCGVHLAGRVLPGLLAHPDRRRRYGEPAQYA